MATITFEGLDGYVEKLSKMAEHTEGICKAAVYEGAAVVLHSIENEIGTIRTGRGVTDASLQGLHDGIGVARMQVDGKGVNTKIGFDGYDSNSTEKYPNGHPVAMMARSIVRGTSFRTKDDFIGRAVRRSKQEAEDAIKRKAEEMIENNMK